MVNKQKGEVSLLNDWTLRYSTNALCELEEASGLGALELANSLADEKKMKLKNLRLMLWAGLLDNHNDVTVKQAGDIIDEAGFQGVGDAIGAAFQLAFPESEAGEVAESGKSKAAA